MSFLLSILRCCCHLVKTKVKPKLNLLSDSPCELFAARSRSHRIPVRGQKDFFPNDSEQQQRRLEQSLSEHWSLISEERVERLWVASIGQKSGLCRLMKGFKSSNRSFLTEEA